MRSTLFSRQIVTCILLTRRHRLSTWGNLSHVCVACLRCCSAEETHSDKLETVRAAKIAFKKYDKDCNGHIDVKEFQTILHEAGAPLSDTQFEQYTKGLLQRRDENRNSTLELNVGAVVRYQHESRHYLHCF